MQQQTAASWNTHTAALWTGHSTQRRSADISSPVKTVRTSVFLTVWCWLVCCCTSVKTTGARLPLYMSKKITGLCVLRVWKRVGEGETGLPMCISIWVQYLWHLKSPLNLVIIAWWASLLFSTSMPCLPPDLATSPPTTIEHFTVREVDTKLQGKHQM